MTFFASTDGQDGDGRHESKTPMTVGATRLVFQASVVCGCVIEKIVCNKCFMRVCGYLCFIVSCGPCRV